MAKKELRTFEDVHNTYADYLNQADVEKIDKSFKLAEKLHDGVLRKSGDPYITHPIAVAGILADLKMDAPTIIAGFLHDVVEDTDFSNQQIADEFGDDTAKIVEGVTKLEQFEFQPNSNQQSENHRKLLLAMAEDARVIIVKLADRLHNMRTLDAMRPEKQEMISAETLEIYAPLAHRLGLAAIKWELEDLSLRYLNPEEYQTIAKLINMRREEREQDVADVVGQIEVIIEELHLNNTEVSGRSKHIYSVYRKMVDKHKQFSEIYDLLALRILVEDIADVYSLLGAIHAKFKPVPGRFKDYIALPKPNGYKSLHTTVIGPNGRPLEIQIRTHQMHQIAEYGVAAHWSYKENNGSNAKADVANDDQRQLNSIKSILELGEGTLDADEFVESVTGDLFSNRSYAFTPTGDVIELTAGSTPLDMAYAIHSEVGHHATGAKVNGNIVPLTYEIKTGDIVDIITSNNANPSRDWLDIVTTRRAKNKIKNYLKQLNKEHNIEIGKQMLEKAIGDSEFTAEQIFSEANLEYALTKVNQNSADDMYAAIGYGDVSINSIMHWLTEKINQDLETQKMNDTQRRILSGETADNSIVNSKKSSKSVGRDIVIEGMDSMLVKFGNCCLPVPGDEIIGYITMGRGVSIHRKECSNVAKALENGQRILEASWNNNYGSGHNYSAKLVVLAEQRAGVLNDIIRILNTQTKDLHSVNGKTGKNNSAKIILTFGVRNIDQLSHIQELLKNTQSVTDVIRTLT